MNQPASSENTPRGTSWVTVQIILMAIIVFLPPDLFGLPTFGGTIAIIAGLVISLIGLTFVGLSSAALGSNLTAFPRPLPGGSLVESGLYALVRHPIYCGVILSAIGWSILRGSVPSLIVSIGLILFFDRKARQEEIWLSDKYPNYTRYKTRVRKLIPFIY